MNDDRSNDRLAKLQGETAAARASLGQWLDQCAALAAPFPEADIEWRIARSGVKDGRPWASVLAYVTNRACMERLDAVVGAENWANEIRPVHFEVKSPQLDDCRSQSGFLCGIGIATPAGWVWKWDGADCTEIEFIKGGISGSMKRAAVQWGIGRYLYQLDAAWANFGEKGLHAAKIEGTWYRWSPPALPEWALPRKFAGAPASPPASPAPAPQVVAPPPAPPAPPKQPERPAALVTRDPAPPPVATRAVPTDEPDFSTPATEADTDPLPLENETAAEPAAPGSWQAFVMPKITKRCAGLTMGECAAKEDLKRSLEWWAKNYTVRDDQYRAKNQEFRDALDGFVVSTGGQ